VNRIIDFIAANRQRYVEELTQFLIREGGSNSILETFEEELGAPTVMFGIGLPDENAHAPNEKLDLENFHRGIVAAAHLYQEIARSR